MDTKEMMTIAVPVNLHVRLKAAADAAGMKLRTLVERTLEAALKKNGKPGRKS